MSFFDDASLVFLPSGEAGKDGKAYSMKPTNGDGDFTFSRGSNLTSTRIDSNGLIEKGRENLLLQSNQFDTTWTTSNSSVTSGQSGYDGSSDAWLLENTSTSFPRIEQAKSISGVVTCSIYAKAGTNNFVRPLQIGGSNAQAYFDLSNGTIANESNVIDAKIESVGSGWYRCSITFDGATTAVRIYSADAVGSFALGNTIIQSAQLEIGLVATEYIESGATTGKAGILEHSPRFDYSGGASCPSLLLEPSRTNLIGYSEYLEGTGWTAQAGITLTPNTTETLSPEGLNNAYKVVSTDATKGFYISGLNVTNDAVRTIYLKGSVGGETIVFKDPSGFGTPSTKTLTTDWQRFEMATTNDGNTYQGLFIDDISVGTIYAYGAQVELGSYPTSYIPNHSGGSVTRNAEQIVNTNISSIINTSNSYTIFFDFTRPNADYVSAWQLIGIDNGGYTSRLKIVQRANFDQFRVNIYDGTTNVTSSEIDNSAQNKIAIVYDGRTSYKIFTNGTLLETLSCGAINGTRLTSGENGTQRTIDNYQQISLFPSALSDAECITLTS